MIGRWCLYTNVEPAKWYCEVCLQKFSKSGKKLSHKYNVLPNSPSISGKPRPPYA